jgi:cytochrome c peroxidase
VVEFYDHGVKPHPNLHPMLMRSGFIKLGLTEDEKSDLVAFLKTLTDWEITQDERFSNPFKIQ